MTVTFFDRQELSNPMNGVSIESRTELDEILEKLRHRERFFFELVGENDKLLVGFGEAIGCVQYSPADGDTPSLVAVSPAADDTANYVEFLAGDTPTPISKRYCMPWEEVRQIINYFLETGTRKSDVSWEEI